MEHGSKEVAKAANIGVFNRRPAEEAQLKTQFAARALKSLLRWISAANLLIR